MLAEADFLQELEAALASHVHQTRERGSDASLFKRGKNIDLPDQLLGPK